VTDAVADTRPKILVVDDTPAKLIRNRRVLQKLDCDVLEARSGREALAIVEEQELGVVVLDVDMPEMNGFEVAEKIHQLPLGASVPIIFCTASYLADDDLLRAYETGAVDYIVEPSPDVIMLSKVRVFLELYKSRAELRVLLEERKVLHARAEHEADHDALTGLANRRRFQDRIVEAIAHARATGTALAVLYIDIDDFKPVNDAHGHAGGDALLQAIALRMRRAVRSGDTVARFGGDEFAIIFPEAGSAANLDAMVERILVAVTEPYVLDLGDGTSVPATVGASIGVALYPDDATDPDSLLAVADQGLYAAKTDGKGRSRRGVRPD
jgi:diguanylate cyclase (GGDEF)-like protein